MRGEWTGGRVSEEDERLLEQFQSGVTRIKKARRRGRGRDGRGIAQEGRGSRGGRVLTGLDKNLHGSCGEQRCAREVLERGGCVLGLLTSPTRKAVPDFPKISFKTAHFRALFRRAFSNRESVWIHVMFTVTTFYLSLTDIHTAKRAKTISREGIWATGQKLGVAPPPLVVNVVMAVWLKSRY